MRSSLTKRAQLGSAHGSSGGSPATPAGGRAPGWRSSRRSMVAVWGLHRHGARAGIALLLVVAVALGNAQLASADTVTNDLQVSGSATITAGEKTTVGYQLNESPGNSDGQKFCNAADGTALDVTISIPADVSATSTKLTFTSCGVPQSVNFTSSKGGTYKITHTLSDANKTGGSYTNLADFTLTVNAAAPTNTAPTVSVTGVMHGADYEFGNVPAAGCKVVDKEDGTTSFDASLSPITGTRAADGLGSQTASCNYADQGIPSLFGSASATYNVVDTTPPVVTVPLEDVTAEAVSASGAAVPYTATALDAVDGPITPTCSPESESTFKLGRTTVTCSATDKAGFTDSKTFAVNVQDTTQPSVDGPDNITAEANSSAGANVSFTVTAKDAVSGSLTPTCTPASGTIFPLGTTEVSCSATDGAGLVGTDTFNITVQDSAKPIVTVKDVVAEATSASGAIVTYTVSAHDTVDGSLTPDCDKASASTFGLGKHTVTCSATDNARNTGTGTGTITVQDTTAPEVTVPGEIVAEATSATGASVVFTASASDAVSGSPTVTCTRGTGADATVESGASFGIGTTTVSCTATDGADNTGTGTFTVKVQDTTAPALNRPANVTEEATSALGANVGYKIDDATDVVDGSIKPSCDKASGTGFPLGTTNVSCSAKDAAGNTSTVTFLVTVQDKTAPVVTAPANVIEEATSGSGALVSYSGESATDAVTPNVRTTCTPASGTMFGLGTTTVTCSATDGAGNTGTGTFTVTVQDATKPDVTVPQNMIVEATLATGAVVAYMGVSASDLVDGSLTPTCDKASGDTYPLGVTRVTCSATDAAKNTGSNSFTITVRDTIAPVVSVPTNIATTATSATGTVVTYGAASASDTVSGTLVPTCDVPSGSTFAPGVTTVTCTATDGAGNAGLKSFTVTVTFNWSNFLQPVNTDGSSVFKLGSTVPVKFKLGGASAGITNLNAQLSYRKVTIGVLGTETEAVSTSAADSGNTFRYDATAAQYIFNLSSKSLTSGEGTYELRIEMGDGVLRTVRVSFKK